MRVRRFLFGTVAAALISVVAPSTHAATEIQWWHAMDGALEEWVKDLADGFNKSQSEYTVNAVYKGNYTEVMTGRLPPSGPGSTRISSRSSRSARRR